MGKDWQLFQVSYIIMIIYQNRGRTTEVIQAILQFNIANLGIIEVTGGHAKENLTSARVFEILDFVYNCDSLTSHVDGMKVFDRRKYYLDLEIGT